MAKFVSRLLTGLVVVAVVGLGYWAYAKWVYVEPMPDGLILANGRIEGDEITAATKLPGRCKAIHVREGDIVETGQLLAELEDNQLQAKLRQSEQAVNAASAQLRASQTALELLEYEVPLMIASAQAGVEHAKAVLEKARAAADQANRDAERFTDLAERGTIQQREGEQARLAATVARNDVRVAEAALNRAEKQLAEAQLGNRRIAARSEEVEAYRAQVSQAEAARDEVQTTIDDMRIAAPTAGIITTKLIEVGETVAAGSPLFELVDFDKLYLKVYVPEVEIGRLRLGLKAQIYTDAFPDRPFSATVGYISSRAEFTPKEVQTPDERVKLVYAVKLFLDENPEHCLTPGMPADAVIRWKEDVPWTPPRW